MTFETYLVLASMLGAIELMMLTGWAGWNLAETLGAALAGLILGPVLMPLSIFTAIFYAGGAMYLKARVVWQ